MRKRNWAIIIGLIIMVLMILVIVFDTRIIRVDPFSIDKGVTYSLGDEKLSIKHPLPPNRLDTFGTDPLGRNVHSLMVVGLKVTITIAVLTALFRLLIAVPIAFYSGIGGKKSSSFIKFFYTFFNIIPEVLVGYVIFSQDIFTKISLKLAILMTSLILAIIGWGKLAKSLRDEVEKIVIKEQGNVDKKILYKKIFPQAFANFFTETGRVLTTLCILGVLGISVGMSKFGNIDLSNDWGSMYNYYPEWSGMLNLMRKAIISESYWLAIFPLLGFAFSIIGFNLIGEGILYDIEEDYTVFYEKMKGIGYHLSPKTYLNEWKNFKYNLKNILIKSLVIIIIVFIIMTPVYERPVEKLHKVNGDNITKHVEELAKDNYSGRAMGTKEIEETRAYIEKELKDIGLMPAFEEEGKNGNKTYSYTREYTSKTNDGETIKGKNIAGYIRGRTGNYPLIIVTNYDYLTNMEDGEYKGLDESGTSIGAALELARTLKAQSLDRNSNRSIIFLFTDSSKYDGVGIDEVIGEKYIDISSFYIYFNYLGVGKDNKVYLNTSTISSGNAVFYDHVKYTKEIIKNNGFKVEPEYFGDTLKVPDALFKNRVSGITFSGISKDEYLSDYHGKKQDNINKIDYNKLEAHTQTLMEMAVSYAWRSQYAWGY